MLRLLVVGLAFIGNSLCLAETASPDLDAKTFQATVDYYRKAKTYPGLLAMNPGFGPGAKAIYKELNPKKGNEKLPGVSFDMNKRVMTISGVRVEFIDAANGKFRINTRVYQWDRTQDFYSNLEHFGDFMQSSKKTASWVEALLPTAVAQNRDDFPATPENKPVSTETTGEGVSGFAASVAEASYAGYALYKSFKGVSKYLKPFYVLGVAGAMDYGVNYAHAHLAPNCAEQTQTLRRLMSASNIALAGLKCTDEGMYDHEQAANISFWTPDKKLLPLNADWESAQAYVDRTKEIYKFDTHSLAEVDVMEGGAVITSGAQLDKYRAKLEPYRQVLYEMGTNNSCYKCESYFQMNLLTKNPAETPATSSTPPLKNPTVQ